MKNKIESLDGLRGLMAFWVFISHVTTLATLPFEKHEGWGRILANGEIPVGIFIILSGFVISLNVMKSQQHNWSEFIIRRFFRLFPVYIIFLLPSVFLLQLQIETLQNIPWDSSRTADRIRYLSNSQDNFWFHLFLHLTLLHGLVPEALLTNTSYAFMGQAWSLTLEWQFYMAVPCLFYILSRLRSNHWIIAFLLIFLVLISLKTGQPSFLLSYLWLFAIGWLGALYFKHDIPYKWKYFFAVLGVAVFLGFLKKEVAISIPIFGFVLVAAKFPKQNIYFKIINSALSSKLMIWLGGISYAVYCSHMIVIILLAKTISLLNPSISQFHFQLFLPFGSLLMVLVLSHMAHIFIELPAIDIGKRKARQYQAAAVERG